MRCKEVNEGEARVLIARETEGVACRSGFNGSIRIQMLSSLNT